MSAIWGKIKYTGTLETDVAGKMATPYREKCSLDAINELRKENCYIGAGIQWVTPEARLERMPVETESDAAHFIFAADCILDNREEIYELLRDCDSIEQMADGELIRRTLAMFGVEGIARLRGIFSIVYYDVRNAEVILATDPTSGRCLYYYADADGVVFSSLLEPMRNVLGNPEFNEAYLEDYLVAPGLMPNLVADETPYRGIYKLEAGTYVTIGAKGVTKTEYCSFETDWEVQKSKKNKRRKPKEYLAEFRELYETCVSTVLRDRAHIGIALSSGFDSASVGAIAADNLKRDGNRLRAYTYVPYEQVPQHDGHNINDETPYVQDLVSMHDNIDTHFLNNNGENCIKYLAEGLDIMEIPYKAYGNLPSLCEVYETAYRDGCRIVLNGQFGNSTVSHGYIDDVLYDLYSKGKNLTFLKNLNHYSKTVKESRKKALRGCINYFEFAMKVERDKKIEYEPDNEFVCYDKMEEYDMTERFHKSGLYNLTRIPTGQKAYREGLLRKAVYSYIGEMETKMSLRYGIVLRDPTRDIRMIRFCYALPYELFAHGGMPRWLIREGLKDLLPESITGDLLRYGMQNSDCFLRIRRDWQEICTRILTDPGKPQSCKWLSTDKMQEYMKQYRDSAPTEEHRFDYYVFAHIMLLYCTR